MDNVITIHNVRGNVKNPHTCATLSAHFGVNILRMEGDTRETNLYLDAPWDPTEEQLAELKQMLEDGQPVE